MNTIEMQTYEEWKEEKLQKIWNLYSHINEDVRIESMSPAHRFEFLDEDARYREIHNLSTKYKGKIRLESKQYDVAKVNKEVKITTKGKRVSMSKARQEYILKSLISYGEEIRDRSEKVVKTSKGVTYDQAIEVFGKLFLEKSFNDSDFIVDSHNRKTIKKLLMYFIGDSDVEDDTKVDGAPLNLNKGIYIFGDVGSGKTNLMYQLHLFTKKFRFESRFEFNDFNQTQNICQGKGINYLDKFKKRSWCHDELIAKELINFGNRIEPSQTIILQSYNRFIANGALTHFTGNANPQELGKALGVVAYSRLGQMCNFIFMGGINRRPNND